MRAAIAIIEAALQAAALPPLDDCEITPLTVADDGRPASMIADWVRMCDCHDSNACPAPGADHTKPRRAIALNALRAAHWSTP